MTGASLNVRGVTSRAIFWNRRPDSRPVASKAAINSYSPAASFRSITANPVAQSRCLSPTAFNGFTAALPPGSVLTASIFERYPNIARMLAAILSRGQLLILNLCGAFGVRSLLPSNPLVPLLQETTCGSFQTLFLAPAFLSVPAFHESNKAWSRQHDAQRNPASRASGASSYE